jgi:hypothetical protein
MQEGYMSGMIDPGAAQPSTRLDFELSDRNPVVNHFGGPEAEGGLVESPSAGAVRVTPEEPVVSPDAGSKY